MRLEGIHHVTAITADAPGNVDFYARLLGLRLVKKTVNQDVTSSYHLFYGDEVGHPGTEMTFFDWPDVPRQGRLDRVLEVAHRARVYVRRAATKPPPRVNAASARSTVGHPLRLPCVVESTACG